MLWTTFTLLILGGAWWFWRSRSMHWGVLFNEGKSLHAKGELAKADLKLRESLQYALSRPNPSIANVGANRVELARVLHRLGRLKEAEEFVEKGLEELENSLQPGSEDVTHGRLLFGDLCTDLGRYSEAERHYKEALGWEERSGNTGMQIIALQRLCNLLIDLGRRKEALAVLDRCSALQQIVSHQTGEKGASTLFLPETRFCEQKWEEATTLLRQRVETLERRGGAAGGSAELPRYQRHLTTAQIALGDYEGAAQTARRMIEVSKRNFSPDHPCVATGLIQLAQVLAADGNVEEARAAAGEASAIFDAHQLTSHPAAIALRQLQSKPTSAQPTTRQDPE
jgi:tetratricopeptide (TPR) repeat protein